MISKSSTHIGSLEGISITRLTGCAKMVTLCNECHLHDDNDNDDDEGVNSNNDKSDNDDDERKEE